MTVGRPTLRLYDGLSHTSPQLNDAVKELQTLLRQYGYRIAIDGEFGPYTENCIKHFQHSRGMSPDGVVGPSTWALLLNQPLPVNNEFAFSTSYAKTDRTLLSQMEELKKYEDTVKKVAARYDIPASVIAGIGSRESHWGLALTPPGPAGTGDKGHGRGLMQIDDRWHVNFIQSGKWTDPTENIIYGCAVLKNSMALFEKRLGWTKSLRLLQAGIAGYNCGPSRTLQAYQDGQDIDFYTTGRDYSRNVLERAGWFQLHGWE